MVISGYPLLRRRAAGETLAEIAKSYAVDTSMISRLKA
jgi:hypothetical protein